MLLVVPMLLVSAFSPPKVTRRALVTSVAASPLLMWSPSANAASISSTVLPLSRQPALWHEERIDSHEERIEKREEQELLKEMRSIRKVEEMEEAQLRRIRAAQKNPLALATNTESPGKLQMRLEDERKAVVADEHELAFVKDEYKEGMVQLQAQKKVVAKERLAMVRSRPTTAMDRLRLKG